MNKVAAALSLSLGIAFTSSTYAPPVFAEVGGTSDRPFDAISPPDTLPLISSALVIDDDLFLAAGVSGLGGIPACATGRGM